jgi:hypothetical protein
MRIEGTTVIHLPIDDVVDFMMDERNDPVWDPPRTGGRLSFLGGRSAQGGERLDGFDIYEYDGPERLTRLMRHTRYAHVDLTSTWAFVAVPDGTRVYVTSAVVPRGILKLLAPLIYMDMTKRAARVLTSLTRAMEDRKRSSA